MQELRNGLCAKLYIACCIRDVAFSWLCTWRCSCQRLPTRDILAYVLAWQLNHFSLVYYLKLKNFPFSLADHLNLKHNFSFSSLSSINQTRQYMYLNSRNIFLSSLSIIKRLCIIVYKIRKIYLRKRDRFSIQIIYHATKKGKIFTVVARLY